MERTKNSELGVRVQVEEETFWGWGGRKSTGSEWEGPGHAQ